MNCCRKENVYKDNIFGDTNPERSLQKWINKVDYLDASQINNGFVKTKTERKKLKDPHI